jgi:hypothetical protein
MRGERLFNDLSLFPDETNAQPDEVKSRGRDADLVRRRNERLCARLHWYKVTYSKWSYPAILESLSTEFDLSIVTIPQILEQDEWQRETRRLWNENPNISYFKNKWPWIKW